MVATLSVVDADLLWADVCTQADVKGAKWCDMTASAQVTVAHIAFCFSLQPCSVATPLIPQWHHKRCMRVRRGLASSGVGALCRTHPRTVMIATSRLPRKMLPLSPFFFEKGTIVCPFTWYGLEHARETHLLFMPRHTPLAQALFSDRRLRSLASPFVNTHPSTQTHPHTHNHYVTLLRQGARRGVCGGTPVE